MRARSLDAFSFSTRPNEESHCASAEARVFRRCFRLQRRKRAAAGGAGGKERQLLCIALT